jgi:DNA-directed RNA polymerase sigma subunit (sigma70/sigma32)
MDTANATRLKRLLEEMQMNGSVHYGELEPLCRDPGARAELDIFLSQLESTGVKLLPDIKCKPAAESSAGTEGAEKTDDHPLQIYLREVARVPPLSSEREVMLLRSSETQPNGDDIAKKELVEANLGLVISIAEDYRVSGLNMLDLIERGNKGLISAVDTFRLGRGYKLSTYAVLCVHRALARLLSRESDLAKTP